ncbi:MAG: iron-containing alcohol dehydrogenase [Hyphomonadaceae bacterium]|nr:iron-containing alcohol dehydrogenase [Hyphomonadaceae bacterium]
MPTMNYLNTCLFDHGVLAQLPGVLKGLGVTKPFVVTDPGLKSNGLLDKALAALGTAPAGVYSDTPANPTEVAAKVAIAAYRASGADGIVALGGGSSMDMAKAVGLLATHEGEIAQYGATQGGMKKIRALPPLVAIPTTAGTGSEVSVGFVLILENGRKETFVSPRLIPLTAICDPELTLGLPPALTAATGMDALTHCIEAVLSLMPNPPAEAVGLDGVERIYRMGMLKRAVKDGGDKDARWHMMMGSYEGALAFVKGLGAVHGLSHALGRVSELKLHHGTLNAIILPHALAAIEAAGAAEEKLARLRRAMGLSEGARLSEAIAAFNEEIGIPKSLGAIGVKAEHWEGAKPYAMSDLATFTNAIPFGEAQYEALFRASL